MPPIFMTGLTRAWRPAEMRSRPIPTSLWCCKVMRREPFASVFLEIAEQQLSLRAAASLSPRAGAL